MTRTRTGDEIVANIKKSGLTIYDRIEVGDTLFWLPAPELEGILDDSLRGLSLSGYALRTRSKVVKRAICEALGYPVPPAFRKTRPRFPGQNFDTYVQKANNLQIWNEDLAPTRRYVILQVGNTSTVLRVKVVSGDTLALLDRTGRLTRKYQARFEPGPVGAEQVGHRDTDLITRALRNGGGQTTFSESPATHATPDTLLPISEIFRRLSPLIGMSVPMIGIDQERKRGAALHRLVCDALGYTQYADAGDFPDVRHQLLEVKLQTAPTIDLGLVTPDSAALLDVRQLDGEQVRHCDVRYAVFYGRIDGGIVRLTHLVVTPGEWFFSRFTAFGGKILNRKLQIPLPASFFTS